MRAPLRTIGMGAALLLQASPALATGTIACVVEDKVLSLALNAPFAFGHGDALLDVSGKIGVKFDGTPRDVGPLDLARQSVAQYWFQGSDLRMLIVQDKNVDGKALTVTVLLDLKRARSHPTTYRGRYVLEAQHHDAKTTADGITQKASGYAECSAD